MQNLAAKTFYGGEGERVTATDAAGTVPSCCERTSDHMQYKFFLTASTSPHDVTAPQSTAQTCNSDHRKWGVRNVVDALHWHMHRELGHARA